MHRESFAGIKVDKIYPGKYRELKQDEIKDKVLTNYLFNIIEDKNDYLTKEKNMKKISYQNTWNKINQKLVGTINEY